MKDQIENKRIEEYSKEFPTELKYLIKNLPKDDIDWSLVMYLFRYSSHGNIITLEKISRYFELDKKLVEKRLNRMTWLITQYINFGSYDYSKPYYTFEISDIGTVALIKLVEILRIGEFERLEKKLEKEEVISSLELQDKIYENLKYILEKEYKNYFVAITYDGKILASSEDNVRLLEKLKNIAYPNSQIFIRKVGSKGVAGWGI